MNLRCIPLQSVAFAQASSVARAASGFPLKSFWRQRRREAFAAAAAVEAPLLVLRVKLFCVSLVSSRMPFNASRWMQQRHKHPRIGPEYQAAIPALEGSPAPRVPRAWLGREGERSVSATAASADSAEAQESGESTGGGEGGGSSSSAKSFLAAAAPSSRTSIVTRKATRSAAARSEGEGDGGLQENAEFEKAAPSSADKTAVGTPRDEPAAAAAFSASLLEEAAQQMNPLGEDLQDALASRASQNTPPPEADNAAVLSLEAGPAAAASSDDSNRVRFTEEVADAAAAVARLGEELPAELSGMPCQSPVDVAGGEPFAPESASAAQESSLSLSGKHGLRRSDSESREAKKRRGAAPSPSEAEES